MSHSFRGTDLCHVCGEDSGHPNHQEEPKPQRLGQLAPTLMERALAMGEKPCTHPEATQTAIGGLHIWKLVHGQRLQMCERCGAYKKHVVLLPEKWTRDVPTVTGWYWAAREGGGLYWHLKPEAYPIAIYVIGDGRAILPGDDCHVRLEQLRDNGLGAFCRIEPAPPCDVELKC